MIKIQKWWDQFECAKSRKLERIDRFNAPARCDSSGYIELSSHGADGFLALGVFQALCQALAGMRKSAREKEGFFKSSGEPMELSHIAALAHVPADALEKTIPILGNVGWIEVIRHSSATNLPLISQSSATHLPSSATNLPSTSQQGKVRKGKVREDISDSGKPNPHPGKPGPSSGSDFTDEHWKAAPTRSRQRTTKKQCEDQWKKIKAPERPTIAEFRDALAVWGRSEEWRKDDGEYVPALHRLIQRRFWESLPEKMAPPAKPGVYKSADPGAIPAMPRDFIAWFRETIVDFNGNKTALSDEQIAEKWMDKTWRREYGNVQSAGTTLEKLA